MSLMATELANEAKEDPVRQSAGLVLKNCLSSKVSKGRWRLVRWARVCCVAAWATFAWACELER